MMLYGKMRIWAIVLVLAMVVLPGMGLGQEDGARKVELTKISSELEKTEEPDGYSGFFEIEWKVSQYNSASGWSRMDSSQLEGYTFTLEYRHSGSEIYSPLVTDAKGFEFNPSTPTKFVTPVDFKITAKDSNAPGDEPISSTIGAHVSELGGPSMEKSVAISNGELIRWVVVPWLDYVPWGVGEKMSTRLPRSHPIPPNSSVMNTILQAKKAIDNSGVVGRFAASAIGVFGNIGVIVFLWGLVAVFYSNIFPVVPKSGGRFIFAGLPGLKRLPFGFAKDPDPTEVGWVAYTEAYCKFLSKWRWVISEMNYRIFSTIDTESTLDLDSVYRQVWRTKQRSISENNIPVIPSGDLSSADEAKLKANNNGKIPDCELGDDYSGKELLESLKCDFYFKLGHKGKPTTRILEAGLKNMVNNGMTWGQASEEVDRAMDLRADQEISGLRRKSMMEYLYFGAAVAPLLGLLGTVTGISQAFLDLVGNTGGNKLDPSGVIAKLAPSINEALWTTVMGLIASICMLIGFHLMDYLFDVVQSKWSKLFVTITEDL